MRKIRMIAMALFAIILCTGFIACSDNKEKEIDQPPKEEPKEEVKGEIKESGSNDYFNKGIVFTSDAGEVSLAFSTNLDWKLTVAATQDGSTWCTASKTNGLAGENEVTIKADASTDHDDRSVSVTIEAGSAKQTIKVTQKQKDAFLVEGNKFEFKAAGGSFDIKVGVCSL